jgi:hypothetical protein
MSGVESYLTQSGYPIMVVTFLVFGPGIAVFNSE